MVFTEAIRHSLIGIKKMLETFYAMSELKASFAKSELFGCVISNAEQISLAILLEVKIGVVPVRYLNVPLISRKIKDSDCQPY